MICKGEEATVSRIRSRNRYNGMVERLEVFPKKSNTSYFRLQYLGKEDWLGNSSPYFHMSKILSLCLGGCLFPDNFVKVHELRFFDRGKNRFAATYSDFVPDRNGVIKRRAEAMRRYYNEKSKRGRDNVRKEHDKIEIRANPELSALAARILDSGLHIPHPEANYHLSDGKIVFFELADVDIVKCIEAARRYDVFGERVDGLAEQYISMMYLMSRREVAEQIKAESFSSMPLRKAFKIIHLLLGEDRFRQEFLTAPWTGYNSMWGVDDANVAAISTYGVGYRDIKLNPPCELDSTVELFLDNFSGPLASQNQQSES